MAAVVQTPSTLLSSLYSGTPALANQTGVDSADFYVSTGTCNVTTNDSVNSQYQLCRVSSGDIVHSLLIGNDALGGTAAVEFGLYNTNSATAVSATLFTNAITMTSAAAPTEERFAKLAGNTIGQRVWQLLGLSSDPHLIYDLCGTLTVVAASNGAISFSYKFSR